MFIIFETSVIDILRFSTVQPMRRRGRVSANHFIASGHYRNGILQAPATAHLMAQLIAGEHPETDLTPFDPFRAEQ